MTEGFRITGHKGFHITFPNGWTVSVQFGPGNYSDNYSAPFAEFAEPTEGWESTTAEAWAWKGDIHDGDVKSYFTVDETMDYINSIRAKP